VRRYAEYRSVREHECDIDIDLDIGPVVCDLERANEIISRPEARGVERALNRRLAQVDRIVIADIDDSAIDLAVGPGRELVQPKRLRSVASGVDTWAVLALSGRLARKIVIAKRPGNE